MQIPCNLVFDRKHLKIINIVGQSFCTSKLYLSEWKTNVVWLITPSWSLTEDRETVSNLAEIASLLPAQQKICVLTNEPAEMEVIERVSQVEAEYINQNTFISPRIFDIADKIYVNKIYDAVVNSNPSRLKRVHLCAKIKNLCCIRHIIGKLNFNDPDTFDAETLNPSFINHHSLGRRKVVELLNQSLCGVILSPREGACYASTEYLYCGLPVISTPSIGGRHVWYDNENSIIVEPYEDAVSEAVVRIKQRYHEGSISPVNIRSNALRLRSLFIKRAENLISKYLTEFESEDVSPETIVSQWLAEIDMAGQQFKYFPTAEKAYAYLNSGNLSFWRDTIKSSQAKFVALLHPPAQYDPQYSNT